MNNLAIIPARGGSKRIPKKNIRNFVGIPILSYSIRVAIESNLFDEIMVSTDDDEIAEMAIRYGAKVPFVRSDKTSNDFATLSQVIDEVLSMYKNINIDFVNFCCILATAPFISVEDLEDSYQELLKSKYDTIRPITRFSYPIQRSFRLKKDNGVEWFFPEFENIRSQDIEDAYHDAGLFYWGKTSVGLNTASRGSIIIPEFKCQDIDTEDDWTLAEMKYRLIHNLK